MGRIQHVKRARRHIKPLLSYGMHDTSSEAEQGWRGLPHKRRAKVRKEWIAVLVKELAYKRTELAETT